MATKEEVLKVYEFYRKEFMPTIAIELTKAWAVTQTKSRDTQSDGEVEII